MKHKDIPDVRNRKLVRASFLPSFIQETSLCLNELSPFEQVLHAKTLVPKTLQTYYLIYSHSNFR